MSTDGTTRADALHALDVLIGRWEVEPIVEGRSMGVGHTEFSWIEGGAFVRQTADTDEPFADQGWRDNSPMPTVSIIGLDDATETFTTLYSDARGVSRVYLTSFADRMWVQWRAAPGFHQRFTAVISDDDTTITGMWEASADGEDWAKDFDLVYRRIG